MSNEHKNATRVAAIYARVSSERQREQQTIDSQIAGLRELAAKRGLHVADELIFCDEGISVVPTACTGPTATA